MELIQKVFGNRVLSFFAMCAIALCALATIAGGFYMTYQLVRFAGQ